MDSNIYTRISALCQQNGTTINDIEKILGFSESSMNKWPKNKPSAEKVKAVADYFHVSMDYLYGRTNIQPVIDDVMSGDFITLQRARQNMSQEDWGRAMSIFRAGFADAFKDQ